MTKLSTIFYSSLFALTALSFGALSSYNTIASKEIAVQSAWSNLGSMLQRRADLVPNILSCVKGYAKHERDTLLQVVQARQQMGVQNLSQMAEGERALFQKSQAELSHSIRSVIAVAESYPTLKADSNFHALQHQLEGCENRIAIARNDVNFATQEFNRAIATFPNNLVNRLFLARSSKVGFQAEPYALKAPEVSFD